MITTRIGDPAAHRRVVGPIAARRLDARIDRLAPEQDWRPLDRLAGEPDAAFETIVSVGAFCASRDVEAEVAEVRRTLAPGGRLVFLEHVGRPGGAGLLHRMSDPLWAAMPYGCHVDHDLIAAMRRGGLVVADLERWTLPSAVPLLRPWVQGVALKKENA